MCGITGFTGREPALPFLLQGLSKLEYRGYDSAGVTLVNSKKLRTWKTKGRLRELEKLLDQDLPQSCGIGHTRWATHGVPSNMNAHPHMNEDNSISVVHNGIVENYAVLKEELIKEGYRFHSDTDSEVIVQLLDYYYRKKPVMKEALLKTVRRLEGSYALCITSIFEPNTIYVAKKESPMVLGQSKEGTFCASDAPALLAYTKEILPLQDGQMAILNKDRLELFDAKGKPVDPKWLHFPYDVQAAQKGGYDSFMLKEIHEQPGVIRETLRGRFRGNKIVLPMIEALDTDWSSITNTVFIACGTAYHACIYAETLYRRYTGKQSSVIPASEFRYCNPNVDEHTLCIFVSQSGETADTLAALKLAKARGCVTIAVVNVLGSSISRQTDAVLYTAAGPEIAVASTKAYTTQLVLLHVLVLKLAELYGIQVKGKSRLIRDMKRLPELTEETLQFDKEIRKYAKMLKDQRDAYFIGRQLDYPSALEGALKLKEVSYVHADAYYAGELKHGPIALIENNTVVIALATQPEIAAKTISNIKETVARGARVVLVTDQTMDAKEFKYVIRIPEISPELMAIPTAVLTQLYAYYAAKEKGCDIDKPRNLAKSVTVE
ncbi:MAG: glutamine--fructose-6-phosphate transaminase (isomerizing) [Solobacterium sp.]|nr:glutamine--fructose-6-phosphate transaminase (isomerizing) [Solobacterium sp.]